MPFLDKGFLKLHYSLSWIYSKTQVTYNRGFKTMSPDVESELFMGYRGTTETCSWRRRLFSQSNQLPKQIHQISGQLIFLVPGIRLVTILWKWPLPLNAINPWTGRRRSRLPSYSYNSAVIQQTDYSEMDSELPIFFLLHDLIFWLIQ